MPLLDVSLDFTHDTMLDAVGAASIVKQACCHSWSCIQETIDVLTSVTMTTALTLQVILL